MPIAISALPPAAALTGTEEVPIVQAGETRRTVVSALLGPPSSLPLGLPVGGGTPSHVLYVGPGGVLRDSADFHMVDGSSFQYVSGIYTVQGGPGFSYALWATNGAAQAYLASGSNAGFFYSLGQAVVICDGTNHVTYTPAVVGNWAGFPPTDVWIALDRLAAWIAANGPGPLP